MSESARPGATVELRFYGYPTGLAGTAEVSIRDGATIVTAATTAGIVEEGVGTYVATVVAPDPGSVRGDYGVIFNPNTAGWSPAVEQLIVSATAPQAIDDPLTVSWRPAAAEVGALLPKRTKDSNGTNQGTFTELTEPTEAQVETIISLATGHLASRLGTREDLALPQLTSRARGVTALYAAMLVELTFFPEQVGTNRSPYPQLKELFDEGTKALLEAVAEAGDGGDGDAIGGAGQMPSSSFPDAIPWGTAGW
jgi:hypothetical protein